MRAALYARVSTSEEKELQDPELQINILKDYCRANGLEIVATYQDRGTGPMAIPEVRDEPKRFKALIDAWERDPTGYLAELRHGGLVR